MPATLKNFARRVLHDLTRRILRVRSHAYTAPVESVTLVLAPHPDDEALGCGGLIFTKRLVASPVHVAYVTDGAASHPQHPTLPPERLASLRAGEARAALRLLGVETPAIHFLNAPDGRLNRLTPAESSDLTRRLTALLREIRPDEIFLPFRHDGSSEHEAAFLLFAASLRASGVPSRVFEFPVWSWWSPRLLLPRVFGLRRVWRLDFQGYEPLKQRALAMYRTQTEPTPPWTQPQLSAEFLSFFASSEEFFFET